MDKFTIGRIAGYLVSELRDAGLSVSGAHADEQSQLIELYAALRRGQLMVELPGPARCAPVARIRVANDGGPRGIQVDTAMVAMTEWAAYQAQISVAVAALWQVAQETAALAKAAERIPIPSRPTREAVVEWMRSTYLDGSKWEDTEEVLLAP